MATNIKKPTTATGPGRVDSQPVPPPLAGVLPAREAKAPKEERAIYPGDRMALVVLIFGLLFMGFINLWDLVRALFRR